MYLFQYEWKFYTLKNKCFKNIGSRLERSPCLGLLMVVMDLRQNFLSVSNINFTYTGIGTRLNC